MADPWLMKQHPRKTERSQVSSSTGGITWDVLIAGGGPAGAAAGLHAARLGLKALIIEKDRHPRFHIGESMLPQTSRALRRLGIEPLIQALPHVPKYGASFALGNETSLQDFEFRTGLIPEDSRTLSIERAPFDKVLLNSAAAAGASVMEGHRIRRIHRLEAGRVELVLASPEGPDITVRGDHLLDASGQGTLVGHHLRTRRTLPDFKRVAFFNHFTGVARRPGVKGGYPLAVMCDEGWFWLIPLNEEKTSIGFVMNGRDAKRIPVDYPHALDWLIQKCPLVREQTREALSPETNRVTADFSYSCRPFAGPGFFLLGDAATFIDPIFSTGVCMGLMSALKAVDLLAGARAGRCSWPSAYREYDRYISSSSSAFFDLAHLYYRHAFRELFLAGTGPLQIHRAVISLLTGNVFPRPCWAIRWRVELFKLFVRLQPFFPLASRRPRFALLDAG